MNLETWLTPSSYDQTLPDFLKSPLTFLDSQHAKQANWPNCSRDTVFLRNVWSDCPRAFFPQPTKHLKSIFYPFGIYIWCQKSKASNNHKANNMNFNLNRTPEICNEKYFGETLKTLYFWSFCLNFLIFMQKLILSKNDVLSFFKFYTYLRLFKKS